MQPMNPFVNITRPGFQEFAPALGGHQASRALGRAGPADLHDQPPQFIIGLSGFAAELSL